MDFTEDGLKPAEQALAAVAQVAPHWFVWGDKWKNTAGAPKMPASPKTLARARVSDMATAGTLAEALKVVERTVAEGVGVALRSADPRVLVVDLDHVRDAGTGVLSPLGAEAVERLAGAYVEVSPSGTGLRAVVLADGAPAHGEGEEGRGRKEVHKLQATGPDGQPSAIELFWSGQNAYCRMSGNLLPQARARVGEAPGDFVGWLRSQAPADPDNASASASASGWGDEADGTVGTGAQAGKPRRSVWDALGDYRGSDGKTPAEVGASIQKTAKEKPSAALAQAVQRLQAGDENSEDDLLVCCEAVRRGAGCADDVVEVLRTLAGRRARAKLKRDDYVSSTAERAAQAVRKSIDADGGKFLSRRTWHGLPEREGPGGKGRPSTGVPEAIAAGLQATGRELVTDQRGKIEPTPGNLRTLLLTVPEVRGLLRYNEFTSDVEATGSLAAFDQDARGVAGPVDDADVAFVRAWAHRACGLRLQSGDVWEAVNMAARGCRVHPVREALDALQWDGVDRLGSWLVELALVDEAGQEAYIREAGRCFFVSAVQRIMTPGAKVDTTLCIEGSGGAGKSTLFRLLAEALGPELFTDSLSDVTDPIKLVEASKGRVFVELAELRAIKGAKASEALKQAMSSQEDTVRKPYARVPVSVPRQFVFVATTNDERYISDPSGALARRFWPVKTEASERRQIDFERVKADAPQLWAQAVHEWRTGALAYISEKAQPKAFAQWLGQREQREEVQPFAEEVAELVANIVEGKVEFDWARGEPIKWVAAKVGIEADRYTVDTRLQRQLQAAMKTTGFESGVRSNGVTRWRLAAGAASNLTGGR